MSNLNGEHDLLLNLKISMLALWLCPPFKLQHSTLSLSLRLGSDNRWMQRSITSLVMLRWEGSSAFTSGPARSSTSSHSVGGGTSRETVMVKLCLWTRLLLYDSFAVIHIILYGLHHNPVRLPFFKFNRMESFTLYYPDLQCHPPLFQSPLPALSVCGDPARTDGCWRPPCEWTSAWFWQARWFSHHWRETTSLKGQEQEKQVGFCDAKTVTWKILFLLCPRVLTRRLRRQRGIIHS